MSHTILITGATDGIGLETAKILVAQGHHVLLHGRNPDKLARLATQLSSLGKVTCYVADLSDLHAVKALAENLDVEMPICEQIYAVLYQGKSPKDAALALLGRSLKSE